MKERQILFSAPMVRAILTGTKTQTRRAVKPQPEAEHGGEPYWFVGGYRAWTYRSTTDLLRKGGNVLPCPYGQPGDRLRVKEAAWMWCERRPNGTTKTGRQKWLYVPMRAAGIWYAADHRTKPNINVVSPDTGNEWGWRLKIGRFLPSWASRITLEVTGVRMERLQDISDEDCLAEGIYPTRTGLYPGSPRAAYQQLWDEINGSSSWDANPWVWRVEFKRLGGAES